MIDPNTPPKNSGSSWVRKVARVTTPQLPPPPPFSAQNRSGFIAALAMRTAPSAVTISASSSPAATVPKVFEKLPKPPLWIEAGDADVGAAAALHIAARLGRDRVIEVDPHRARAGADRGTGGDLALAALRREGVVERHRVHRARPDQQRVGRVGGSLIAVARAFHDEAQRVVAGEIHRRRDVGGVDAPSPHRRWAPASRRRASRKAGCRRAGRRDRRDSGHWRKLRRRRRRLGSLAQAAKGAGGAIRLPPTASFSPAQSAAPGQAASPGRTRRNVEAAAALRANARGNRRARRPAPRVP